MRIDIESVRLELAGRLPKRARWIVTDAALTFDFSRATKPLRHPNATDIVGRDIEEEWTKLFLFGEQDYADGGGACPLLCVHELTGEIYGLDVERTSSPIFFLNSDADAFVRTFHTLDDAFRTRTVVSKLVTAKLIEIDPHGFTKSDWKLLVEAAT